MAPVTLVRAKTVYTCDTNAAQHGISNDDLGRVDDAAILFEGGVIEAVGRRRHVEAKIAGRDVEIMDLAPSIVVPGFVDTHAHPLFAGNREPDFVARAQGLPPPLGMEYTVHETRKALEHPLSFWQLIERRLKAMLAHGTTTLETKTGYALHKPGEGELLSMIDAHKSDAGIPRLVATFLGAHALPPEFFDEIRYIDYLIDQVIPIAKAHGAVYADAFCEPGYFSPAQTRRYLESARAHGLRLRVHCDEMGFGGAAEMAVELGVDAIDHCNYIREQDVRAIAAAGIVTVA
ncbi:MAG: amidohydrolase family protein, partial [Candidatus Eremiobacteraeota bacterium]|nr:amidohydrolase family protein [Candidatus Eremiobacteraeota bacterium]